MGQMSTTKGTNGWKVRRKTGGPCTVLYVMLSWRKDDISD